MEAKTIAGNDVRLEVLEQIGSRLTARFRNASEEFSPFRSEVLLILKQVRDYRKAH
jgi:hypothetical protein